MDTACSLYNERCANCQKIGRLMLYHIMYAMQRGDEKIMLKMTGKHNCTKKHPAAHKRGRGIIRLLFRRGGRTRAVLSAQSDRRTFPCGR